MSHFTVAVFSNEPDEVEDLLAPYCEEVEPGSEYSEFVEDDDFEFDEVAGKHGLWTNPEAKWDWYSIGGRWSGMLTLKDGTKADSARVRDCNFKTDKNRYNEAARFWEVFVEGCQPRCEQEGNIDSWYKPEYYKRQYASKEEYAKLQSTFVPFAFISADGEWHEPGQMGWFGDDDSTAESRQSHNKEYEDYLKFASDEDLYITVVDCHI